MEAISVFDMLKIGVGPSSSHTLGPWRAAQRWVDHLKEEGLMEQLCKVQVKVYGSLALTGKGHATDVAILLGLSGEDPVTIDTEIIPEKIESITKEGLLQLGGDHLIKFNVTKDLIYRKRFLPYHANGLSFLAHLPGGEIREETYYSIGGGFVIQEFEESKGKNLKILKSFPFPIQSGNDLLEHCHREGLSISEVVLNNERTLRTDKEINRELQAIWEVMLASMYEGCHREGILPGGLQVKRRGPELYRSLKGTTAYSNPEGWLQSIRKTKVRFRQILKWVSCFALGVNEVNASLGRIVTAPTNGSAGVVPAVLMYYLVIENHKAGFEAIKKFLLVAGEIGSLFKKGATISAAMGGCQAEIGVSSAMAAAALTELHGGSPEQVLVAAEIAMEHHLGLTCDPIGGLVQVPCIERNSMGAIKAINAAELALECEPKDIKVPFDKVVSTMWETAKDMHKKYKETSKGGLAVGVFLSDC